MAWFERGAQRGGFAAAAWVIVGAAFLVGCAQSHDVILGAVQAGDGGAAGSAGMGGSAGTGGTAGGAPQCVVSECEGGSLPFPIPGFTIDACCTEDNECGLSAGAIAPGCMPRNAPGTPDSSCPSQSMGPVTAAGCCTAAGVCGVNDTFIGFGCVEFGGPGQPCGGGAGAGGAGGSGGAGGTGGTGGNTCTNCQALGPAAGLAGVTPCCTTTNACGGSVMGLCVELGQAGTVSSQCPTVSMPGLPVSFQGCCRPDGTCGAMDTFIGFGCAAIPGTTGTTTCTPDGLQ